MENIAGNYTKRFSNGDVRSKIAFKFVTVMKKTSYGLEHTPRFEASRYDIERSPGNYIKRLSEEID